MRMAGREKMMVTFIDREPHSKHEYTSMMAIKKMEKASQ